MTDEPTELRAAKQAAARILVLLQPLSEVRSSAPRMEGMLAHGTSTDGLRTRDRHALPVKSARFAESSMPAGISMTGSHAPSKQLSLYAHYKYRFMSAVAAEDAGRIYRLVGEATRDYEEHTGKRRALRFSGHGEAVSYLLSEFTGVPAEKAAIEMRTPNESFRDALRWVHRQRAQNGCDPELGERRANDERTARVYSLAEQGLKQRMIASEVGISQARVSQILAGR